jgi:LysM repeat protein
MTEESDISLSSQEPRHCPVCGIQVAAKASECLMCGASLTEEGEPEQVEERQRKVPSWVGSVAVVVLALIILGGGGFGLYAMLAVEPEPTRVAVTPSPTSTPVPSPTPTDTPVPTSTPTPLPPRAHDVQQGETVSDIAELYGVTVDEILALNADVDPELIKPGQVLLIPASTPAITSSGAGEAEGLSSTSSGFVVHVVSSGETLSSIAEEYDVSVSVIRAANDLSPDDETIRAEQSLVIPMNTPTPTPTPTADPDGAPTPLPLYASPPLLYPPDGAVLTGGAPVLLQWASIDILKSDEWYELYLWQPAAEVVSSTVRTHATAWRVPFDLLEKAGGDAPRFLWRVQVVREAADQVYEEAGAPSAARSFVWRGAAPTPQSPTPSTP